jgi:hypothetical protein
LAAFELRSTPGPAVAAVMALVDAASAAMPGPAGRQALQDARQDTGSAVTLHHQCQQHLSYARTNSSTAACFGAQLPGSRTMYDMQSMSPCMIAGDTVHLLCSSWLDV